MAMAQKLTGLCLAIAVILLLAMNRPQTLATVPELTVTTITGQRIDLKTLRGKPVIVTFWATDCPGCIKEIPHLLELYQAYQARGLELLAIAMYYDPPSHVLAMSEARHLPYPVVLDLKADYAKAFGQVALTPTTFLIAPDGRIALQYIGLFDTQAMRTAIETFLKG
ncbi:MAG: TlpA disulfide reductase family protein [Methylovulum sp.]|nr:TlpA disulfide reductase family protein [Methylovulum sp.]MDD2724971.1 TlpA disulfide reductase family protein [Methylovulum sp.]MDD5123505.1 TlpA disulfide reductase family protein [Methylovulum sp.]